MCNKSNNTIMTSVAQLGSRADSADNATNYNSQKNKKKRYDFTITQQA